MSPSLEMIYNEGQDRWVVNINGQPYELHCGEGLDIIVGHRRLNCTLELSNHWYIITEGVSFNLKEQERYRVVL